MAVSLVIIMVIFMLAVALIYIFMSSVKAEVKALVTGQTKAVSKAAAALEAAETKAADKEAAYTEDAKSLIQWGDSGKCLDVRYGQNENGAIIQIWHCEADNPNQHFTFKNGRFQWRDSSKCLDVSTTGGNANGNENGTRIQLLECGTRQNFKYERGQLRWGTTDKCLDVTDGRNQNGTKIQLWTCNTGNPNQQFTGEPAAAAAV